MSEFGHFGAIGAGFCIDNWGAGPFVITVGTTAYRFEDSERFGPTLINKDGSDKAQQPGERSPFWKAHFAWIKQGRRLADDGVACLWEPLKPTTFKQVGRHKVVVEYGDHYGPFVEIKEPFLSPFLQTPKRDR